MCFPDTMPVYSRENNVFLYVNDKKKYESSLRVLAEYILKFAHEHPASTTVIHKIINKDGISAFSVA